MLQYAYSIDSSTVNLLGIYRHILRWWAKGVQSPPKPKNSPPRFRSTAGTKEFSTLSFELAGGLRGKSIIDWDQALILAICHVCVYIWASIARYLPPPHPMVMGLYSSAPVPPSPLWCGWWWVVVVGGGVPPSPLWCGWCGWWWVAVVVVVEEVVYVCIWMYQYPPPPCGVGGVGGGGWWWWKKLYMYVYECIWWYECIFLVFAYDYDMICIW